MSRLVQWILRAVEFLGSVGLAAALAYETGEYALVTTAWAMYGTVRLHAERSRRHLHAVLVALSLVTMITACGLVTYGLLKYAAILGKASALLGPLLGWLNVALPLTAVQAAPMANALILLTWLVTKWLVLSYLSRSDTPHFESLFGVAYKMTQDGWWLKPWFPWAKSVAFVMIASGFALIGLQWSRLNEAGFSGWVPIFPVALAVVGIECWQWLSGPVDESIAAEFTGDTGAPDSSALFEDLWSRYRQVWPAQWRAAGNRAPESPER